jgi:peptidoglycan/LPS O-acetylase OafA/YrhL
MGNSAQSTGRVGGLDTIRFLCALTIVIFHFELLPTYTFGKDPHGLALAVKGILGSLFNGPAALIVFFVISGFGIHFAFRRDLTVDVPSFYSRRLIRISGPALIALAIWALAGIPFQPEGPGPFWTITCEAEYYLLYPLLVFLRRQFGWWPLIVAGQIFAYGLAFSHVGDIRTIGGGYPAFGWWNWVMGLPCWLTGCWLAEVFDRFPQCSTLRIWLVRGFVLAISIGLNFLRFHGGFIYLSCPFTLNLFAILACFWLGLEIAYRNKKPAPRLLEWAGNWTYSIYLMHPAVPGLLRPLTFLNPVYASYAVNTVIISSSLLLAYGFHLAVEAPFYRLAIRVGRRLKTKRSSAVLAVPDS